MRHIIAFVVLLTMCVAAQTQRVSHSFRNAPLAEVLTTLSREAKDHDIVFIHNELENCRVTARFNSLTIPEAVAAVTAEQPVRVKERGRTIFVQYRKRRDRTGHIYGNVRNLITREVLKGVKVTMLNADSTEVIATTVTGSQVLNEKTCWYLELPLRSNGRILRFDMDGYETTSLRVSPMTLTGKSPLIYFKPVYMQRKAREVKLNEVVVKATKVKFTYRGDTLVYNADAFQLSEGSMLDALIRQLPGAELKANGQIIVNGRVVESLLLNGEDFFKKDRRIMLDNLPSYMVQNVKVYEKQSEAARTIGMKTGDEPLVMDVHLKRQYNTGLIAKERLDVEYSLGDLSVGFNGTAGWNSSRSRREGFRAVDVRTFNYGPTLKIGLPWGLRLATDLTVYTNRGFSEPSANTTDVVWNARLSKRFMGSRLTLSLDGFDILGQLSNITHTLNSQGLTETWHNSLPRYVMAHLTWRFNKEPKKF